LDFALVIRQALWGTFQLANGRKNTNLFLDKHEICDGLAWNRTLRLEKLTAVEKGTVHQQDHNCEKVIATMTTGIIRTPRSDPSAREFYAIISINYIGDGLSDAFDPYKVLEQIGEV
jgi:hypothetical protein